MYESMRKACFSFPTFTTLKKKLHCFAGKNLGTRDAIPCLQMVEVNGFWRQGECAENCNRNRQKEATFFISWMLPLYMPTYTAKKSQMDRFTTPQSQRKRWSGGEAKVQTVWRTPILHAPTCTRHSSLMCKLRDQERDASVTWCITDNKNCSLRCHETIHVRNIFSQTFVNFSKIIIKGTIRHLGHNTISAQI